MAYIPDNLGERRRRENVSQTACEFFVKYCEHADKETGLTFANPKTCAGAFGMRIDNARKYDRELISKQATGKYNYNTVGKQFLNLYKEILSF